MKKNISNSYDTQKQSTTPFNRFEAKHNLRKLITQKKLTNRIPAVLALALRCAPGSIALVVLKGEGMATRADAIQIKYNKTCFKQTKQSKTCFNKFKFDVIDEHKPNSFRGEKMGIPDLAFDVRLADCRFIFSIEPLEETLLVLKD